MIINTIAYLSEYKWQIKEWFSSDNVTDLPIADYISDKLSDVCIWHEIYFSGKEEEENE